MVKRINLITYPERKKFTPLLADIADMEIYKFTHTTLLLRNGSKINVTDNKKTIFDYVMEEISNDQSRC